VFLDQPPGWYLLLRTLAIPFGNSVTGMRTGLLVVALVGLVAAWAAGRALGGPAAGLGAAALLAVAPPYPTLAATVESDPPATVLALLALAAALYAYREGRSRPALAVASGSLFALALSVKLFAVAVALPIAALALRRRRVADAAWPLAGFGAVLLAFVVGYRHVLHEVWRGVFGAHLAARGGHQPGSQSNLDRIAHVPDLHTPFGLLALLGLALALAWVVRGWPLRLWPLWLFTGGATAFTLTMRPLLDHHLVLLATALAVPAGAAVALTLTRIPRPLAAGGALVLAALVASGFYQEHRRLARNAVPEPADYRWAARQVEANSSPGDLVVSDIPSIPYLAHRRMPGQLIDSSIARIVDEYLKPHEVLRLIAASHAPVVVVGRNYEAKPAIVRGIARRYPRRLRHGDVTVYLRAR
jgi:4-amino-4-deoxy-L-arabinose transferase-like glycosyltransferase